MSASELAPRIRVASDSSISKAVPSRGPPVMKRVGTVTLPPEEESLTGLRASRETVGKTGLTEWKFNHTGPELSTNEDTGRERIPW